MTEENPSHDAVAEQSVLGAMLISKQNMENIETHKDSEVPYRGVTRQWRKKLQAYVYIGGVGHNGIYHYCGQHSTPELAHAAVQAKRNELFTHNDTDR